MLVVGVGVGVGLGTMKEQRMVFCSRAIERAIATTEPMEVSLMRKESPLMLYMLLYCIVIELYLNLRVLWQGASVS
jgi:hypothetical protein